MTAKLPHRTAVAELVAAIVKAPRTMRELCEMTDMTSETVNAWVREFMASGVVYIADYRKNATGSDSPVYGWVKDDEADVPAPELATNPAAVRVRTNYRKRRQAARLSAPTTVRAEAKAWTPTEIWPDAPRFSCALCNATARLSGSGWHFTGVERVRICGACKTRVRPASVEAVAV